MEAGHELLVLVDFSERSPIALDHLGELALHLQHHLPKASLHQAGVQD
ncbi:hypothetical protein SynA18461_00469 [Synechococcus sp. A18-46.1]|nr:hypothetical protein SynA18461_00469 [Synechococcus sp. A18-46.1]